MRSMDKINGLKDILELDPSSSFARYGIAMERVSPETIKVRLAPHVRQ